MKKILLVSLLILICMCTSVDATKVSFGGWRKWDEEFPPKSYWKNSIGFLREIIYLDNKAPICIAMNRYMENKNGEKISIILFSPFGENPESVFNGTGDYQFVLVAFPPEEKETTIRAYKKENKKLVFLEEWIIPYENDYSIFKNESSKFIVAFKEWVGVKIDIRLIVFEKEKFTLLFDFEAERKEIVEYLKKTL